MKRIILLLMIVCLIGLVNAETDTKVVDDTFQVNKIISYSKPCFYNGSYCSSDAECNFTIFKPDNSILYNNLQATNQVSRYNISIYVDTIGIHTVNQVCCDGLICGSETYYFDVTGSGYNKTSSLIYILLLVGAGLIALAFWIKDAPMAIFGSFVFYFIGIYFLLNGIDFIRNLWLTRSISIIIIGAAAYISVVSGMEMMGD